MLVPRSIRVPLGHGGWASRLFPITVHLQEASPLTFYERDLTKNNEQSTGDETMTEMMMIKPAMAFNFNHDQDSSLPWSSALTEKTEKDHFVDTDLSAQQQTQRTQTVLIPSVFLIRGARLTKDLFSMPTQVSQGWSGLSQPHSICF